MRRGHPQLNISFEGCRASVTGLTDPSLEPSDELFAVMRADDDRLATLQAARAEVSADWLKPHADAGHPDAILFLAAIERIAARRTAGQSSEAA